MRRIRYSVAASLDGFIAGPKGEYDWIPEEPKIDFQAFLETIDTILMGRNSYEVVMAGPGLDSLPEVPTYVVSRTLLQEEHPGVEIVGDGMAPVIADLKKMEGKDIWLFGGATLFASLVARDLVDTVEVGIVPVLLGKGIPLLPAPGRVNLSLDKTESFPSGIVLSRYRVHGRGRP